MARTQHKRKLAGDRSSTDWSYFSSTAAPLGPFDKLARVLAAGMTAWNKLGYHVSDAKRLSS